MNTGHIKYQDILRLLFDSLPMYQRVGAPAYKADLSNAYKLDAYFNYPHKSFISIHIGGTNGKGSVSHMIASVLQEAGYKTGLFTSPHMADFRERIKVDGIMLPEDFVIAFTKTHLDQFKRVRASFFEMTVFMAFDYFVKYGIDIAVVEVGLGGRLDTTNIITPVVSVITNIGSDHTQFLGNTLISIAGEKAGIIKQGIPVVIGESQSEPGSVFSRIAAERNAPVIYADKQATIEYSLKNTEGLVEHKLCTAKEWNIKRIVCDLAAAYQQKNIITSLAALEELKNAGFTIDDESIRDGFRKIRQNTGLSGRWQITDHNPYTVCDVAHNAGGFECILSEIANTPHKRLHMVLGFVNDKDIDSIIRLLPADASYTLCEPHIPRAMKNRELEKFFENYKLNYSSVENIGAAYTLARSQSDEKDLIYIGGSTFLVADFLAWKKSSISF
jgi:dihydrofolate synthase/folylpolyglutamate synthase